MQTVTTGESVASEGWLLPPLPPLLLVGLLGPAAGGSSADAAVSEALLSPT